MTAPTTGPRTLLPTLIETARPNRLIVDLAEVARAARLAESNRIARIADALAAKGEPETAVHLYQRAINLLTAA